MSLDEDVAYRWERTEASWESMREDAQGNIVSAALSERDRSYTAKKRRVTACVRRGLIRYLVVAIDCSSAASEKDMRPCRLEMVKANMLTFIRNYFDQNPISQLSIIITCDGIAEVVTELSGNPKNHEAKLKLLKRMEGDASLQNLLLLASNSLVHVPNYGTRELLIVYNSLKTRDPGDIFDTIQSMKANNIRVSAICTAAELSICKRITVETAGTFDVSMHAAHFGDLLMHHTIPPPQLQKKNKLTTEFVYMGFPKRVFDVNATLAADGSQVTLATAAYVCPRCFGRTTELPTQCNICGLQLNSSTHIARSHHHLFPVPNYVEFIMPNIDESQKGRERDALASHVVSANPIESSSISIEHCGGCLITFQSTSLRLQCPVCSGLFCVECDIFIHENLHNCPGCC